MDHDARVEARNREGTGAGGPWAALPLGLGTVLLGVALVQVDRHDTGGTLGLVAVLPATWWLALAACTVGFAWLVVVAPRRRLLLGAHLVLLVAALHATPGLIESHGRFPTAWTHVGFIDHVVETGSVDPDYDARYNWPGAFGFGGFLVELTGAESARALVRFTPVVVNLLLLAPLALLAHHVTRDDRVRWVALWLAVLTNWVGQDYLAPQPLALLGYLVVVGVLLQWFRRPLPRPASAFDLLGRLRRHHHRLTGDERLGDAVTPPPPPAPSSPPASALAPASPPTRPGQALGLVVLLAGMGAVLAFSHQLTPVMLAIAAVVLVVAGRVDRPLVAVALAVCAVAWTAFGATSYLRDNLSDLTGAVGDVGGVVADNQGRIGPDRIRQLVLATRLVVMAVAGGLAAVGLWRQWRARRADWGLAGLAVAPAALVLLGSYGGEVLLRVSLFALPFLALLGAFSLVPEGTGVGAARRSGVLLVAASAVLLPLVVTARYGNEAFERIHDDDVAAWDHLVDNAPEGATVVVPDFAGPWRYRDLMRFDYRVLADEVDDEPTELVAFRGRGDRGGDDEGGGGDGRRVVHEIDRLVTDGPGPGYLVLGTASAHYREVAEGYPEGWADTLTGELVASGDYRIVFESGETRILERMERNAGPATAVAGLDLGQGDARAGEAPEAAGPGSGEGRADARPGGSAGGVHDAGVGGREAVHEGDDGGWSAAQATGAALAVLLVGSLLGREAWALGALPIGRATRRTLDVSIVVLLVAFAGVVVVHLVSLS